MTNRIASLTITLVLLAFTCVAQDLQELEAERAANAKLKGSGKNAFNVIVGLATGGAIPPAALALKVEFGENVSATISAASFTRKGSVDVFAGDAGGITKVTVDYARAS